MKMNNTNNQQQQRQQPNSRCSNSTPDQQQSMEGLEALATLASRAGTGPVPQPQRIQQQTIQRNSTYPQAHLQQNTLHPNVLAQNFLSDPNNGMNFMQNNSTMNTQALMSQQAQAQQLLAALQFNQTLQALQQAAESNNSLGQNHSGGPSDNNNNTVSIPHKSVLQQQGNQQLHPILPAPAHSFTNGLAYNNLLQDQQNTHHQFQSNNSHLLNSPKTMPPIMQNRGQQQQQTNHINSGSGTAPMEMPTPLMRVFNSNNNNNVNNNIEGMDSINGYGSDLLTDEEKRNLKRAANRKSAQASRKRKKAFIEELRLENEMLRKKEQILSSIPDVIIVFDSSGHIYFASHAVIGMLGIDPKELEGQSFWDRLCDDSTKLVKSAFMDALAARKHGVNSVPLAGVSMIRLRDANGKFKKGSTSGVVHFTSELPECVCSIRPIDEDFDKAQVKNASQNANGTKKGSGQRVNPSVISFTSSEASSKKLKASISNVSSTSKSSSTQQQQQQQQVPSSALKVVNGSSDL